MEIIGEASYKLTLEFKDSHPEVEWKIIINHPVFSFPAFRAGTRHTRDSERGRISHHFAPSLR